MPGLSIWKDKRISRLKKDMDHIFERVCGDFGVNMIIRDLKNAPFIDISETAKDLILRAEITGAKPDDFDIAVDDDTLTITGETKLEVITNDNNFYRTERRYGSFSRTIQLPCRIHINDVKATYKKGILKIVMPKCKRETARKIKVKIR